MILVLCQADMFSCNRLKSTCVYADRRKFNKFINSLVTDQLVLEGDTGFIFNIWLAYCLVTKFLLLISFFIVLSIILY